MDKKFLILYFIINKLIKLQFHLLLIIISKIIFYKLNKYNIILYHY